jgi:mRNA-degrading endonuclease toxin of MazEF toxin-antitoxin module
MPKADQPLGADRLPAPLRGEIWQARLPRAVGQHFAVILTRSALAVRFSAVSAVLLTTSDGPSSTHIQVDGADLGLPADLCRANCADVWRIERGQLTQRRAQLHPATLKKIDKAVMYYMGFADDPL